MTEQDKNSIIYFHLKAIQACIFLPSIAGVDEILKNVRIVNYSSDMDFMDPELVYQILEILLKEYKNYMDKQMKENAFHVLWYFEKLYTDIDSSELINRTNNLKVMINSSDDSKINEMIIDELLIRFLNKTEVLRVYFENGDVLDYVKRLICNDFHVLLTHSSAYTDDQFQDLLELYTSNCINYISSINSMLMEYPDIKQNKLFSGRVRIILDKISDPKVKRLNFREKNMYKRFVKKLTT